MVYFTAVKIVNFRLHRALGRDPVEEDQKEEPGGVSPGGGSPEGVSAESMSPSKDVKSVKMNELSDVALEDEITVLGGEGVKEESFTQIKGVTVEVTPPKPEQTTLPEPPAFMKETSEDIARQGGASLSQSSSPSTEGVAQIEMTSVESKPDQHAGVSVESKPDQHAGVNVESKPDQHTGVSVEFKPDQQGEVVMILMIYTRILSYTHTVFALCTSTYVHAYILCSYVRMYLNVCSVFCGDVACIHSTDPLEKSVSTEEVSVYCVFQC